VALKVAENVAEAFPYCYLTDDGEFWAWDLGIVDLYEGIYNDNKMKPRKVLDGVLWTDGYRFISAQNILYESESTVDNFIGNLQNIDSIFDGTWDNLEIIEENASPPKLVVFP